MIRTKLLLVDYENVHRIDLSVLDESYIAVIFVGANQNPPKAARKSATAHRFSRVEFQKVEGAGKNALDFHIAFHLGRTFETAPTTECFVLSKDKGFDPLLTHLNRIGLKCRRVVSVEELLPEPTEQVRVDEEVVCERCKKARTIEHLGGRWCPNCGRFASPPDPEQLPSNQPRFRDRHEQPVFGGLFHSQRNEVSLPECGSCHQRTDMAGGIYDDGEWMCGDCIARYVR
jgi:hypothetical protein